MSAFTLSADPAARKLTLTAPTDLFTHRPVRVAAGHPLHWSPEINAAFADCRTRLTERLLNFFGGIDGLRVNCAEDGRLDQLEFTIQDAKDPDQSFRRLVTVKDAPRHIPMVIKTYENLRDLLDREGFAHAAIEVGP